MEYLKITPTGVKFSDAQTSLPQLAKVSLDTYANSRLKELGLTTKAMKYNFPFYETSYNKAAFHKLGDIIIKYILKQIPYLKTIPVPFMDAGTTNSNLFVIRTSPADLTTIPAWDRYVGRLRRKATELRLPVMITAHTGKYVNTTSTFVNTEHRQAHTFEVMEIRISLDTARIRNGYFLLFHLPAILKVLTTLHRTAHYDRRTEPTAR